MRHWLPAFAGMTALALGAAPVAAAQADHFEIVSGVQPMARLRVKHTDLNVRVALGFDKALLLNLPAATKARLKAFPLIGKQTFKSNLMPGGSALIRGNLYDIAIDGLPETSVPTIWFDKELADDSDGVISLLALPAEHVTIIQPNAPKGGLVYGISRAGKGDAAMIASIGGEKVHVILDVRSPETLFNGRAAQLLESAGMFKRTGRVGLWHPFPGSALPFEHVVPTPGATLLGLPLVAPAARITEAHAKELDARAKAGTSSADQDDDAITVTATKKKQQPPWILIGRDVLDHCSRIELDRPGERWALTCNFAGVTSNRP
ncbi:hypothetical protein [Polymorphobacter megasporae]|uniref:hypothetical protein n=1 Tax=Glacieibacterium megasporae TaxID=2835787 RepID=UPI001C1DFAA0|nr:hypothetical protein [Polymorphobacter megasporae]UAJ10211.1 hypothetical protein KTC28_00065 [Polymorphobacter megasporae]